MNDHSWNNQGSPTYCTGCRKTWTREIAEQPCSDPAPQWERPNVRLEPFGPLAGSLVISLEADPGQFVVDATWMVDDIEWLCVKVIERKAATQGKVFVEASFRRIA